MGLSIKSLTGPSSCLLQDALCGASARGVRVSSTAKVRPAVRIVTLQGAVIKNECGISFSKRRGCTGPPWRAKSKTKVILGRFDPQCERKCRTTSRRLHESRCRCRTCVPERVTNHRPALMLYTRGRWSEPPEPPRSSRWQGVFRD